MCETVNHTVKTLEPHQHYHQIKYSMNGINQKYLNKVCLKVHFHNRSTNNDPHFEYDEPH